jgi:hypothetical protein
MVRRRWRRTCAVLACALSAVVGAPPAMAASTQPSGVSVTPVPGDRYASASGTHLELGLVQPASPLVDRVRVLNVGSDPLTVDLYGADAIPAFNGGFGFSARGAATRDVGAWITLAATRLQLPPHSTTTLGFRLLVPPGASGGEHVGGIVAEPVTTAGGSGVQTKTRFAMGVYLRLPGTPSPSATPSGGGNGNGNSAKPPTTVTVTKLDLPLHGRDVCPTVHYRNDTGDVIDPSASLTVSSSWGLGTHRVKVDRLGAVLPGASATVKLPCVRRVAPGPDSVTLTVASPKGTTRTTRDLFVAPWPLFVALLFLLLLLILIALELWRRKRARERELAALRDAVARQG